MPGVSTPSGETDAFCFIISYYAAASLNFVQLPWVYTFTNLVQLNLTAASHNEVTVIWLQDAITMGPKLGKTPT